MVHRTSRSRLRPAAIWILAALAVPCLVSSLAAVWGLPAVVATGVCPAAPPDIPAYPCSPQGFLLRMTLGPGALAGHLIIGCAWLGLTGTIWLVVAPLHPAQAHRGAATRPARRIHNHTRSSS
ncbi:MAG TPA: hypothetical protein VI701_04855, partial [Anaerolineales bacterium]|nr:hypothetical protein [Anaerolineales bacterium]